MRTHATKTSKTDRKKKKQARQGGRLPRSTGEKNTSASAGGHKKTARSKRAIPKTTPKTTRSGSKNPVSIGPESFFPKLRAADGDTGKGVFIALAERSASALRIHAVGMELISPKPGRSRRHQSSATVLEPESTARILGGLAHADRIRLMIILESGEQSHKTLADAVSLKPGPLYHHLRALERAGLIHTEARNRYELTAAGKTVLMIVSGLWTLTRESKRMAPWRRHRSRINCAGKGEKTSKGGKKGEKS